MKKQKLLLFAVFLFSLLLYSFIEPHWISTDSIEYPHKDIPASFDGYTIAFISDFHAGKYFSKTRLEETVHIINKLTADLVVLGGDYTNGDTETIPWCFEVLGNIKARSGVYGVLGNHDHYGSAELTRKVMLKNNIQVLDNTSVWISYKGERIKLGGVGDLLTDLQNTKSTVSDVYDDDFVVLLSHNPDYAEMLPTSQIDLMLSGHTHGGQVTFFGLFAPILPTTTEQKYRSGLVKGPRCDVFITNGIGTITTPVRFFARPQISVIKLKAKNTAR
ncbi:MAG: metallophosphoesterase [Spirochaetales bacterium]|nr:metallophosphoesterase [Spirochaetales bacterium]